MVKRYSKILASLVVIWSLSSSLLLSQTWIERKYEVQTQEDVLYGVANDFAGNSTDLWMDVSTPINDTVGECGRPLMIIVHGGAWLGGDKADGVPGRFREEFAERGYTTASINYRLGLFQTNQFLHCNISNLGAEWDCLNMTDTSEWYRAYYRGVQDLNGAIRFLVNHSAEYEIDPNNIFLTGISAGSFNVMGAGFIDTDNEVLTQMTGDMEDVQAPNINYEASCVVKYNLDTSIASMQLARPDLGGHLGKLNFPAAKPYVIRGVGAFFGAVFNNIFETSADHVPSLYLFHQPGDLIVPFNNGKLLQGFSNCATNLGGCAPIVNRNQSFGSASIVGMLEEMKSKGQLTPDYLFERTNNNANCFLQLTNPNLSAHAIDNFQMRSINLATFFAPSVKECDKTTSVQDEVKFELDIYPSLINKNGQIKIRSPLIGKAKWKLVKNNGEVFYSNDMLLNNETSTLDLSDLSLSSGMYIFQLTMESKVFTKKIVLFE